MTSTRAVLLAFAFAAAGCGGPTEPSHLSSVTGAWTGRFEQTSCTMPLDTRPCAFNRVGSVTLTLVQSGDTVTGQVEFWSDQGQATSPLIGPLAITGTFSSARLLLAGTEAIPTPVGNIERALHGWETELDPGTGRMRGSTGWRVVAPQPPIIGASPVTSRGYAISALRRVAR